MYMHRSPMMYRSLLQWVLAFALVGLAFWVVGCGDDNKNPMAPSAVGPPADTATGGGSVSPASYGGSEPVDLDVGSRPPIPIRGARPSWLTSTGTCEVWWYTADGTSVGSTLTIRDGLLDHYLTIRGGCNGAYRIAGATNQPAYPEEVSIQPQGGAPLIASGLFPSGRFTAGSGGNAGYSFVSMPSSDPSVRVQGSVGMSPGDADRQYHIVLGFQGVATVTNGQGGLTLQAPPPLPTATQLAQFVDVPDCEVRRGRGIIGYAAGAVNPPETRQTWPVSEPVNVEVMRMRCPVETVWWDFPSDGVSVYLGGGALGLRPNKATTKLWTQPAQAGGGQYIIPARKWATWVYRLSATGSRAVGGADHPDGLPAWDRWTGHVSTMVHHGGRQYVQVRPDPRAARGEATPPPNEYWIDQGAYTPPADVPCVTATSIRLRLNPSHFGAGKTYRAPAIDLVPWRSTGLKIIGDRHALHAGKVWKYVGPATSASVKVVPGTDPYTWVSVGLESGMGRVRVGRNRALTIRISDPHADSGSPCV